MLSTRIKRIIGVAALAIFAGLATFPARAQFNAPYDSDFAPAPPPAPPSAPPSEEPAPYEEPAEPQRARKTPAEVNFWTRALVPSVT